MKNPSATLYVKSSRLDSAGVTAGVSDQLCRLSVSQEEDNAAAAASARKSEKSLFPDCHRDKAASAPRRNVKAPPRRRNIGASNQGEMLSHPPDPPVESKGSSGWMRSSWKCQTTERGLEVDPDPQGNTRKMRGSTRKQTVLPSQESPDRDDMSPEQSDGSLMVRRAKRSNRLQKKRGGDSPQLQHLEESRTQVKGRGRGEKDRNKKISEATTVKSSTSSKKPKIHKASAQILAEEDEDKWTEEELAALQECVWFPDQTAQCCLTALDSRVCVCVCLFTQGSGALSKTQGGLLGKGGQACGNTFCRRVLQPARLPGNLPLAAHERQEEGKETSESANRPR